MEAWRQWLLGGRKNLVQRKNNKIHLTPAGLLMEGVLTQIPTKRVVLLQLRVLGFGLLQDGDVGVGVFSQSKEALDVSLMGWILAGVQRQNRSDLGGQRGSSHPAKY